ncbi:MAG: rhodanese-like domain-containing protein [Alphaproteobacteria bacterium GM7ARS4]|nr:rhodanese-like domain-containing protein [Alphaproteobacteria bacterium GM7ARS4]
MMPQPKNTLGYQGDVSPHQAWDMLSQKERSYLIDCRTDAEWRFVGIPDTRSLNKKTLFVSWQLYPNMQHNDSFIDQIKGYGVKEDDTLLFICRSGGRSRMAAIALHAQGFHHCYNVADGFEGHANDSGKRSLTNGWKYDQLPWVQE